MSKLMDFLMEGNATDEVTMEVSVKGFPEPFVVRSISEAENKAIRKACQTARFDKKTHQKVVETDNDQYNARLIAACCVDPNFKDADLQEKYGVKGAEALINKLLTPHQFLDVLIAVNEVNGFQDDINDLVEDAKNS